MPGAALPNDRWSLDCVSEDCVSDQFVGGRRFRIIAIYDNRTRECLTAVADVSLSGRRVARELDLLIAVRPALVSDNGTELTSNALLSWAIETGCRPIRTSRCKRLHRKFQWLPARRVPG
jgi:putative transposase